MGLNTSARGAEPKVVKARARKSTRVDISSSSLLQVLEVDDPIFRILQYHEALTWTTSGKMANKAFHILEEVFWNLFVFTWDNICVLLNLVLPKYEPNEVVPKGAPGYRGVWPAYHPPGPGDSRSACPMLNAMANHGILPHDGKNITFKQLNTTVRQTFNFAPSFCFFVPKFSANFLSRSYFNDKFDLADLSMHSEKAIEHDASLTRQDAALSPDQGVPDQELVDDLLNVATGKCEDGSPRMTIPDLSRALSKRRADARKSNRAYTESFFHNLFGSAK